ncbi:MAG: serine/threonine protein kinase [Planctomycetia bacterium]|nr:serine/threonine protein kinase [Planctomycetia bacterium]
MQPTTAEELAHLAQELELVAGAQLDEAWSELGGHNVPIQQLGSLLLRRELLTNYQIERLLRGDRRGFYYGSAKVLYQVGAGAFARVYRAANTTDGGILAVKVLRARYNADAEKCKSFRREGEMGRLLRHPNIVAIEDVGQEHTSSYITMEFVEGQTLRELVRIRGALDLARGLDLIVQMAAGLEYAHRRGVTHRDLKASNVLVSSLGKAKLVDFGLAGIDADTGDKALGKVEHPRTIDYATLEKLSGMKDDGIRSDVYFLGTLAYLALGGAPALVESRDRAVRADPRRFTTVVPLATRAPGLPRDVIEVVGRMMHLDPLERWQTVTDAKRSLEQLVEKYTGDAAVTVPAPAGPAAAAPVAERPKVATRGSLMLVERPGRSQQALREFFTKLGYKVLLTENPQRALARFSTTPVPADGLVLCAQSLGEPAVEAFNTLTTDPFFSQVPAVLLVSQRQTALAERAAVDGRRKVMATPFHSREMAQLLDELLEKVA